MTALRGWWKRVRGPSVPPPPAAPRQEDVERLLHIVCKALRLQASVEELLPAIRGDGPIAEIAPRAGPVVSGFEGLRRELREVSDPALRGFVSALDEVFDYHAQLLYYAVQLLGVSWRSERLREQQRQIDGVGPQGERLWKLAAAVKRLASATGGEMREPAVDR
jgi:hypothetical protein